MKIVIDIPKDFYNQTIEHDRLCWEYMGMNEMAKVIKNGTPLLTGRWVSTSIKGEIDGQIVKAFTCSKCGAISVFRMTDEKIVNGNLCANCGCRMVEQESEDK